MNVRHKASDLVDLADEVAGEVDDMGPEIPERSRAGFHAVEPPHLRVGITPVLQVAAAEVADLAELAGIDQLPRETDGRDEAVVERAQMLDAGCGHTPPNLVALVGVAPQWLLADDVLACLGSENGRLGVERVRPEVVEELDVGIGDELLPARRESFEPVALGGLAHGPLIAACYRDEPRP